MRTDALTPCVGSKIQKVTDFLRCKKRKKPFTSLENMKKRRNHVLDPGSVVENNRDLASSLAKARAKIVLLESGKVRLQGERQALLERVATITAELEKCSSVEAENKAKYSTSVKEISKTLYSTLEKTTGILLQCSNLIVDSIKCVGQLHSAADSLNVTQRTGDMQLRTPLNIVCTDIIPASCDMDAAESLTAMTPSPSSSSEHSMPSPVDDNVLFDREEVDYLQEVMDIDIPELMFEQESLKVSFTPTHSPTTNGCQLATTPEVPYTTVNPVSSAQISPTSPVGRRHSKRRKKQNFAGYKEPSLMRKLRQGDPHTDCSLYSQGCLPHGKERYHPKRKNVPKRDNLRKKIAKTMDNDDSRQSSNDNEN